MSLTARSAHGSQPWRVTKRSSGKNQQTSSMRATSWAANGTRGPRRRAHRRGLLVLPRAALRHPPWLRPWADLAVKLMLKWPNLYYSTSAFAPKHYPADIVDYANTRGADKILYAGYFSAGLGLGRIFEELPHVPFRDHVWPKFLRENALRVFDLE